MKRDITSVLIAGLSVLLASLALLYIAISFFPTIMEEYYNAVFRSSSFETDWLFYVHPFVLSAGLKWFWERFKGLFGGSMLVRAAQVSVVYGAVAILPVLWLTFSAIDISIIMVITWLAYGIVQALVACTVYAKMNP
jgi:uncharacterized membrane protein